MYLAPNNQDKNLIFKIFSHIKLVAGVAHKVVLPPFSVGANSFFLFSRRIFFPSRVNPISKSYIIQRSN